MIPVKIQCGCGQKYAFDVEPVDQGMGWPVQCPVCGADGTTAANLVIAHFVSPPVPPDLRLRIGEQQSLPKTPTRSGWNGIGGGGDPHLSGAKARNKWFISAIGASAIVVLVLAGSGYAARRHGQKLDAVSRTGGARDKFPRTLAELNTWYAEPPKGQNAATIYLQGFEALQLGNGTGSNLPLLGKGKLAPPGVPLPAPEKSAVTAFVRANREALHCFAQGAKYEQSRYPADLSLGFEVPLPHVPKVRSAALLLELSAVLHTQTHEGNQAADDVVAALALARSLEAEPSLLSQSVRAASVAIDVAAWEQIVNRTTVPDESLSELMSVFKKMEEYEARGEGFNRGLVAERAIWRALLDAPQKLLEALSLPGVEIPAEERERLFARLQKGGKLKDEQESLGQIFEQLMDARKVSFPARLKADGLIRMRLTEARAKKRLLLGVLLPAFAGRSVKEAESLARLRLGMAAVALEQFRAAHDESYPTDLAQLSPQYLPAAVLDPFDGAPLRYRKSQAGYTLYSIGPDLKDDSGGRTERKEGDIGFAVVTRKAGNN